MKRLSVVAAALVIAACSPAAEAPAAPQAAAPGASAPVGEQAGAIPLTREFLVGRWGDNGDCNAAVVFNADGTYQIGGAPGRWTLAGDIITMSGAAGSFPLRAQVLNQNQILIGNPDGSVGISQRC